MARGRIITDSVKILIAKVYKEHPKWKNAMIRNEVSHVLRQQDKSLPSSWPSKAIVDRILADIRKRETENPTFPEDQHWILSSLEKYPLPYEALPIIAEVFKSTRESKRNFLTIRQAKWLARLYLCGEKYFKFSNEPRPFYALKMMADTYAYCEHMAQVAGVEYDSLIQDIFTFLYSRDKYSWDEIENELKNTRDWNYSVVKPKILAGMKAIADDYIREYGIEQFKKEMKEGFGIYL